MKKLWDLTPLYESFDSSEFENDYEKAKDIANEYKDFAQKNFVDTKQADIVKVLEQTIELERRFSLTIGKLFAFSHLTRSTDVRNNDATVKMGQLMQVNSEITKPSVMFINYLKGIKDLATIIKSSDLLSEHEYYLMKLKGKSDYMLSDEAEVLLSKMTQTGSTAWTELKEKMQSTLVVEIELGGEEQTLPLTKVRNMAYSNDQTVRKVAYEAELNSYKQIEEVAAAALNCIKGEAITVAKMRGYDSVLEKTLNDSAMDQKTLDAMLGAIEDSLPKFREYYKAKARLLGHKDGLPFYDVFAPIGNAVKIYTYEEATELVEKTFRNFSNTLGDMAKRAFDEAWIDVEPRDGKRGGAFCSNLPYIGQSRVMLNFDGSFGNVKTLAHELGHAYHGQCIAGESILNTSYPMPLAETASIFCETLIKNSFLQDANEEEKLTILEGSLLGAGQVIVDIYSRFIFESAVINNRENRKLSAEELNNMMLEAQKEAYGDALNHEYLHHGMWVNKPHYYSAGRNFYNFPYAFGQLFALGLYAKYQQNAKVFKQNYDRLLAATGKMKITDVAKMMDINVQDKSFWESSLKVIIEDITEFINLVDNKQ